MGRPERVIDMAPGFSARPDYQVRIEPAKGNVIGIFGGETIVDSRNALILHETRHAPTYYFPKSDVRMDLLVPSDHHTHCPFKGNASYWSLELGDKTLENVVWSYEQPYGEAADIAGYVAFYWDKMEAWFEDGKQVFTQADQGRGKTANPLVDWLLSEAWDATTSRELTHRFIKQLKVQGMRIVHINVAIRTLHPLLAAISYRWAKGETEITRFEASHDLMGSDQFLNSPLKPVFQGVGGVRRRIDAASVAEYAFLGELEALGATDYVAMPMRFSDGQINAVTLATDAPDGFSVENLGYIHEILPMLSRLYEVHAKERSAATLMRTFMGAHTGERVLNGKIKRGDGEDIHAVIWFSDLRNSTPLAESMSRADFLDYLNKFFDGMAGAVVDNDGEILRFIGDAVLAIFPIENSDMTSWGACQRVEMACERAVSAAKSAIAAIAETNLAQQAAGAPEVKFGIGIHIGDLTYGNIGIPERLEFTVVGAAANEAARIEAMTKELNVPVLISSAFANSYKGDLVSVGRHHLRGVEHERELFTIADA